VIFIALPAIGAAREGKIVFDSARDGNNEIYPLNPDSIGEVCDAQTRLPTEKKKQKRRLGSF
jgi:hypothetical protein